MIRHNFAMLAAATAVSLSLYPRESWATTSCCAAPASGLISWWAGEDSAADIRDSNHGALQGGASFGAGRVGSAFAFNGVDGVVRIPDSPSLNPAAGFSIEAWVHLRCDADNGGIIFAKWADTGAWTDQRAYDFGVGPGGTLGFAVSDVAHQRDAPFHRFDTAQGAVPVMTWTHVAATFEPSTGTRRMFINGGLVATRTDPPFSVASSVADASIGANVLAPDIVGFAFPGMIDEVMFYDRALTDTEVHGSFIAGAAGHCRTPPPDADGDGVCDADDSCPALANADQSDRDGDAIGDACDPFPDDPNNAAAQCDAALVECLARPVPDADGDGEADVTDRCPNTPLHEAVDDAGCSLRQFCTSLNATTREGRRACKRADWQNDEAVMKAREADCTIEKGERGHEDDRCVPTTP